MALSLSRPRFTRQHSLSSQFSPSSHPNASLSPHNDVLLAPSILLLLLGWLLRLLGLGLLTRDERHGHRRHHRDALARLALDREREDAVGVRGRHRVDVH